MSTRAQLLTGIKARLYDPNNTRWSNADLELYLAESINKYSKNFPREREQEFLANGLDARFNVPSDLLDDGITRCWVIGVDTMQEVAGGTAPLRGPERRFEVVGQELIFNFVPLAGETVRVRYNALYPFPATDDTMVPLEDDDLIYIWAMHLAWLKIGGQDASLQRWDQQGKRDDSPIIPHYVMLERQYHKMVAEKKDRGRFLTRVRAPRYGHRYQSVNDPVI